MRKFLITLIISCLPLIGSAQIYESRGDIQYPKLGLTDLEFMQGSYVPLSAVLLQDGSAYTNIAGYSAKFRYATSSTSTNGFITATNTTVTTATGSFLIPLTTAQTSTNGTFWYTIEWLDASGNSFFSGTGTLEIVATTVTGDPVALTTERPVNWANATYSSLASAPMIVGTNLIASTNASGQVTVSASPGNSGDITSVTTTNPITGGGSSGAVGIGFDGTVDFVASGATNLNGSKITSGTVADARIASTIARDSEFQAADTIVSNALQTQITSNDGDITTLQTGKLSVSGTTVPVDMNDKDITNIDDLEADRITASISVGAPQVRGSTVITTPLIQIDTDGIGFVFQSDKNSDVGTSTARARTVYAVTNSLERTTWKTNNVLFAEEYYGTVNGTNAFIRVIGTNTYELLFN